MSSTNTMTCLTLKAAYQLISAAGRKDRSELRDSARGGLVVFAGTYKQCVAEAKRRGIWVN